MAVSNIPKPDVIRVTGTITTSAQGNASLAGIVPAGYAPVALEYSWQVVFATFAWQYSNQCWWVKLTTWDNTGVALQNIEVAIYCVKI